MVNVTKYGYSSVLLTICRYYQLDVESFLAHIAPAERIKVWNLSIIGADSSYQQQNHNLCLYVDDWLHFLVDIGTVTTATITLRRR